MNDSRVLPARLYGQKLTGGKVELLVERITGEFTFLAHIKASKALKPGGIIQLEQNQHIRVLERQDDLFFCQANMSILDLLNCLGHIPLPPYIEREDEKFDQDRYQTIYAKYDGSVAAPTAGLHFDDTVFAGLAAQGVNRTYVTLHVGAGTFRPVRRCDQIKDHKMHSEYFSISQELCQAVAETKKAGKRVIAVGTTALRSLESASREGELKPCNRDTDIFIYPGFEFKICDGLITNFHLPESLMMLVSAFIGHKETMALYQEAIEKRYRFFSYGDASLLFR